MLSKPSALFQFVGFVLPVSFIALRILLDEINKTGGVSEATEVKAYMNYAVAMVAFLVAAGWCAILDIVLPPLNVPFANIGYVLAAIGITVPIWLLLTLRDEVDVTELSEDAPQ